MRQAMGATWVLGIMMSFIILFTAYISVAINLAKSFQVKNNIVSMVELNEGYEEGDTAFINKVEDYLDHEGYFNHGLINDRQKFNCVVDGNPACSISCLIRNSANQCEVWIQKSVEPIKQNNRSDGQVDPTGTDSKTVYRITTFYKLDVPVIDLAVQFPISSDTRPIFDFANNTGGDTP